jgi:hypothetical protein
MQSSGMLYVLAARTQVRRLWVDVRTYYDSVTTYGLRLCDYIRMQARTTVKPVATATSHRHDDAPHCNLSSVLSHDPNSDTPSTANPYLAEYQNVPLSSKIYSYIRTVLQIPQEETCRQHGAFRLHLCHVLRWPDGEDTLRW